MLVFYSYVSVMKNLVNLLHMAIDATRSIVHCRHNRYTRLNFSSVRPRNFYFALLTELKEKH